MNSLIILAMLTERERYGYEISKLLKEKYALYTRVSSSSIYYTLDRLAGDGLISKREEKVGNRPTRSIYTITPLGKKEFRTKLLKMVKREGGKVHQMDPFNLPFSLMDHLPQEILSDYERKYIMEKRKVKVGEKLIDLKHLFTSIEPLVEKGEDPEMDLFTLMLIRRGIVHLQAENRWIKEVIDTISKRSEEDSE